MVPPATGPASPTVAPKAVPCKQCGADLHFAPGTTTLQCPYCAAQNTIEVSGSVDENDFAATLARLEQDAPHTEQRTIRCQACAAEATAPPNVTSFACPFCGSNIVSQVVAASRITPHGVLPFQITRENAVKAFRTWIGSLWFAPGKLKNESLIDAQLTGIYLPAWTYDSRADTVYQGERGEAYYVTVGTGNNRRTERRVRWYPASGRVQNAFDDVLVIASQTLPMAMVTKLEPWDLRLVQPYADDFLAGFCAETYKIDLRQGWVVAQQLMAPTIDATIRSDIGGDEQRITAKRTAYSGISFKHLLLPVWVSAYRYSGKTFRFLVNARTGEVQGERPWSAWKIASAITAGLLVIGLIVFFASRG